MTERIFWAAVLLTNLTVIGDWLVLHSTAVLHAAWVGVAVVVILGVVVLLLLARLEPQVPVTDGRTTR